MAVADPPGDLEVFLTYLSSSRGFDFTAYKRPTLARRVQKRMQDVDIDTYSEYMDYLETHPDEFTALFNTILINVTAFLRDAPAWDFIAREVIPRIIERKAPSDPIRVWSTGCASGEEAFSLAILFAEAMGLDAYRQRVKIYGTDVDEDALSIARHATYSAKALEPLSNDQIEKYFEPSNGGYVFRNDLRRTVIFGRLDLLQDAPISRVDLLVSRNTLMYFNADAQARVMSRFMFALGEYGYLFLGKAETLLTHTTMLTPVDLKLRIFQKTSRVFARDRTFIPPEQAYDVPVIGTSHNMLREIAFETDPSPQITVDTGGTLTGANDRARQMFDLHQTDIGRPLQDLELSYRPLELRSLIEQAHAERRNIVAPDVEWTNSSGIKRWFGVIVYPLWLDTSTSLGVNVVFTDITRFKELQTDLEGSRNDLQRAYEELQSSNEEMETTNEELQSTVEELETTNEELQSTNEELETMNEELQSTNEELDTVNVEMRARTGELDRVNTFLESILTSLHRGVVVLNRDLAVLAWNRGAEELWGLRAEEVSGRHFLNLDIGLPVHELQPAIRRSLAGDAEETVRLAARNRRGRDIACAVDCMPFRTNGDVLGVILLMEEVDGES